MAFIHYQVVVDYFCKTNFDNMELATTGDEILLSLFEEVTCSSPVSVEAITADQVSEPPNTPPNQLTNRSYSLC